MIARLTCWVKGHDWHYHGAWYRFCRRCGVEQVCGMDGMRWRDHDGGMR